MDDLWQVRGVHKIGVIYQDDTFGQAVLEGVQHALARHQVAPIGLGTFQRNTVDVSNGVNSVRETKPDAA